MTEFSWWFAYFAALAFILGATFGSFLNVCIHRIPLDQSVVRPRSHCPHCGHMIAWYDNVPLLSYLWLRARCRHCGQPISVRYFLVEALTGTLFLLVWWEYGFDLRTPVYWMAVSGLILGTFVDFDHMILPDRVTIGGTVLGFVFSPLVPELHAQVTRLDSLREAVIGWAVGFGLLWIVGLLGKLALKREAMGFGDVKLLGAMGAWCGWKAVLFIVVVSSFIGAMVGIVLMALRKHERLSHIPYGPYLALAAAIWILWGYRSLDTILLWLVGSPDLVAP